MMTAPGQVLFRFEVRGGHTPASECLNDRRGRYAEFAKHRSHHPVIAIHDGDEPVLATWPAPARRGREAFRPALHVVRRWVGGDPSRLDISDPPAVNDVLSCTELLR